MNSMATNNGRRVFDGKICSDLMLIKTNLPSLADRPA